MLERMRMDSMTMEAKLKDHINIFKTNMCREIGEVQDVVRPVPRNIEYITEKVDKQAKSILAMSKSNIQDVICKLKEDSNKIGFME